MSLAATIPLLRPVLPHENLLALVLFGHSRLDGCTAYQRLAYLYLVTIGNQEDFIKINLFTDFIGQLLNAEAMSHFGAVLPTATFHNCVHVFLQKEPA